MNRRQIALKLVLDELGLDVTPALFDEQLKLQKVIYLVQQLSLTLGYSYSWNTHGPYSRELNGDGQALLNARIPEGWALEQEAKTRLRVVRELLNRLWNTPNGNKLLQHLAAVLFVQRTGQGDSPAEIAERLRGAGQNYTAGDVEDALRFLPHAEPHPAAG